MKLDLDEIENWEEFENLVTDYFKDIQKAKENNLTEVFIEPSGKGSDGGRDILLSFRIDDSIVVFQRKWIIQCKFYKDSLKKSNISSVNIPSLIHEYGANGYLLVCKNGTTSKVTEMFENLRKNCSFKYDYLVWTGSDLISKLLVKPDLIIKYFPKYAIFLKEIEKQKEI